MAGLKSSEQKCSDEFRRLAVGTRRLFDGRIGAIRSRTSVIAQNTGLTKFDVRGSTYKMVGILGNGLTVKEVMENVNREMDSPVRDSILAQYADWLATYNPKFLRLFPLSRDAGRAPGIQPQNVIFEPESATFIIIDPT